MIKDQKKTKPEHWVSDNQAQFIMVAAQVSWTEQVEDALGHAASPASALQQLHHSISTALLAPLTRMAAGRLSGLVRRKVRPLPRCVVELACKCQVLHLQRLLALHPMLSAYVTFGQPCIQSSEHV